MADMKQIFTYPNNSATDFIDPLYIGNSTSGLTRRADELLAGTYRNWSNLDPVSDLGTTNSELMQNLSTYINYYVANGAVENLTVFDFYDNPLIVGTTGLIGGVSISSVVYTAGTPDTTVFTTSTAHSFTNGDSLILSGFNGMMTQYNGDTFYAKVIGTTTLQLSYDQALTNLFIHGSNSTGTFSTKNWNTVSAYSPNTGFQNDSTLRIDLSTYVPDAGQDIITNVLDGTRMDVNTVEKNGTGLVNNSYYVKSAGGTEYDVYEDSGLTNPLKGSEITGLTAYQKKAIITPTEVTSIFNIMGARMVLEVEGGLDATDGENYINMPTSQTSFQYNGFTGAVTPFPVIPLDNMEYFKTSAIPTGANNNQNSIYIDNATTPAGIPVYYFFNSYYDINWASGALTMEFYSTFYNQDPLTTTDVDYFWEVLAQSTARFKTALPTMHCLPVFDGFKFTNIQRYSAPTFPSGNDQPYKGDMTFTQDGLPVLDPVTISMQFEERTDGIPATSGQDTYTNAVLGRGTLGSASAPSVGNMIDMADENINIIIWKPGTNLDDYRMTWDDFGVLNIHEKDGSNNWTVPVYTEAACGSTNQNYCASDSSWTFSNSGVGSPAIAVRTVYSQWTPASNGPYYWQLESHDPTNSASRRINADCFNALWGTSYDINTVVDVQVSPMPHNLTQVGQTISFNETFSSSYSSYNDNTETLGKIIPWNYSNQQTTSGDGMGLMSVTNHYPQVGRRPTLFQLVNQVTINPTATGDMNAEFIMPANTIADQGDLAIDSNFPYPYQITNLDIIMPGDKTYSYVDVNNVTQYAAEVDDVRYWKPGETSPTLYATGGETAPDVTIGVNGSGKLASTTINVGGRYATNNDVLIPLQSPADTYNPAAPTVAELEDVWDTDDEWASDGDTTPEKVWPHHVTPMSAVINYNSPTLVNNSQSGIKYTRSVGHTKWRLEVEYPPMTAEDFQKFHAVAQAAHGQSTPFLFKLQNKDGVSILWKDFYDSVNTTISPLIKSAVTPGDTTLLVEGFSSNEADAFKRGEVFIDGENENGNLHTSLSETSSNIFGEAKIRTPWPFRTAQLAGTQIHKNPEHAIVTLASDNFEYQVDVNNYYFVSVAFDLDSWK